MQRSDYLYQVEMGTLIFLANKNYSGPVCELHDNDEVFSMTNCHMKPKMQ